MWDLRFEGCSSTNRLEFWMQSICTRVGTSAPVILLGTHSDAAEFQGDDGERLLESRLEGVAKQFSTRFANIRVITCISCVTGEGLDALVDDLVSCAIEQPHMGETLPATYSMLENEIVALRTRMKHMRTPPIIPLVEYEALCWRCHIVSPTALQVATHFLHDIGSLLYFRDEHANPLCSLGDIVIIDPKWLIDMMSKLITTTHNYCRSGIVSHENFQFIWRAPYFPIELHDACFELLHKFNISFPLGRKELIPCLLPEERPDVRYVSVLLRNRSVVLNVSQCCACFQSVVAGPGCNAYNLCSILGL
jgi:hypothetical protein